MRTSTIVANISVLLTFLFAAILHESNPDFYYLSVQEDEYLEWATFWGFAVGAYLYTADALRHHNLTGQLPWFVIGLAAFCFLIAMEEISWGQRLFDYKAPDYFLQKNYQQELNIHNVVDTSYRKLVMQIILLGYGVILSGLRLLPSVRILLRRWGIVAPPPHLIPSFLTMYLFYVWYPWSHTGEWVEFAMAQGFVFAAIFDRQTADGTLTRTQQLLTLILVICVLAALTVGILRYAHRDDPDRVQAAQSEIAALAEDFGSGQLYVRCGIHKRLFTFMREYRQPYFLRGAFARMMQQTGNDARGEYLLDPWNSAYWIRHKCDDHRESMFVYSLGPNRRRNSTAWEIRGDDIGAYIK